MPRMFSLSTLLAELPTALVDQLDFLSECLESGKLRVRCKTHGGEYLIVPGNLRRGQKGCVVCADVGRGEAQHRRTTAAVNSALMEAVRVHGGKYGYEHAVLHRVTDEIDIVCPEHGIFSQTLVTHAKGHGCPHCASTQRGEQKTAGVWGTRFAKIDAFCGRRGYTHNAVATSPAKWKDVVEVTCPRHGVFQSTVRSLVQGKGCWRCFVEDSAGARVNAEAKLGFEAKARAVHGGKYDYDNFRYVTASTKGDVMCRKHARVFSVTPNNHLRGKGCPSCGVQMSKAEEAITEALRGALGVDAVATRDRSVIAPFELDIYIPTRKLAIEFDGLYFHSTVNPNGLPRQHLAEKSVRAARKGVRVIHVFESEFETNRDLVLRHLLAAAGAGAGARVGAREADVVDLSLGEAREFFEENHLQGGTMRGGHVFALRLGKIVVAALHMAPMQYYGGAVDEGAMEIVRYATVGSVRGGLSRLFAHACATLRPATVVSYCDNRWFSGGAYSQLGFRKESEGAPSTIVVKKSTKQHVHRSAVTHDKLRKILGAAYDPALSHDLLAYKAGYFILYDCGQSKWVWTPELNA